MANEIKKPRIKKYSTGVEIDFPEQPNAWTDMPLSQDPNISLPDPLRSPSITEDVSRDLTKVTPVTPSQKTPLNPETILNTFRWGQPNAPGADQMGVTVKKSGEKEVNKENPQMTVKMNPFSQGATAAGVMPMLNDPEVLKRISDLSAQSEEKIGDTQERLKLLDQTEAQTSLAPLMALSDTWFKGNLLKGYDKPSTPEELLTERTKLEDVAQKERTDLIEALSKVAYNKGVGDYMESLRKESSQYRNMTEKLMAAAGKDLKKDTDSYTSSMVGAADLERAVGSKDYARINQKLEAYGRYVNGMKGAGTEGDVKRQLEDSLSRVAQSWTNFINAGTAKLKNEQLSAFRQNLASFNKKYRDEFQKKLDSTYNIYKRRAMQMKADELVAPEGELYKMFKDEQDRLDADSAPPPVKAKTKISIYKSNSGGKSIKGPSGQNVPGYTEQK